MRYASSVLFCCLTPVVFGQDLRGGLTIYMSGGKVASESYTLHRGDGKIDLNGSGHAEIGPMKIVIEKFEVVTDDKYQPQSAEAKAQMGQITMAARSTFANGKAKTEADTGQGPQAKEDDVHADTLVINANLPLYPFTLLMQRVKLTPGPQNFFAYVLGQAEVPVTVTSTGKESVDFAGKKADLNHLTARMTTPQGQDIELSFWIDDTRKIIKMAAPAQNVEAYEEGYGPVIAAVVKPAPAPAPVKPPEAEKP